MTYSRFLIIAACITCLVACEIKTLETKRTYHSSGIFMQTKDDGLKSDDSFTVDTLQASNFFYYGMVNMTDRVDMNEMESIAGMAGKWRLKAHDKKRYESQFVKALRDEREPASVTLKSASHKSKVDDQGVAAILQNVKLVNQVSEQALKDFNLPSGTDFLILSAINKVYEKGISADFEKEGKRYRRYESYKHIEMTTYVVDARTGRVVWSYNLEDDAMSEPNIRSVKQGTFLEEVSSDLNDEFYYDYYPRAPHDKKAMKAVIYSTMKGLPKKTWF